MPPQKAPVQAKRVKGFVTGYSKRDHRELVVQVTDSLHELFRKQIRVSSIRRGEDPKQYDSVDFFVTPGSGKLLGFAADVAKL